MSAKNIISCPGKPSLPSALVRCPGRAPPSAGTPTPAKGNFYSNGKISRLKLLLWFKNESVRPFSLFFSFLFRLDLCLCLFWNSLGKVILCLLAALLPRRQYFRIICDKISNTLRSRRTTNCNFCLYRRQRWQKLTIKELGIKISLNGVLAGINLLPTFSFTFSLTLNII